MGAATSPGPWEWPPLQDRIWTNPGTSARAAPADSANSLASAFEDLNISTNAQARARPVTSGALDSNVVSSVSHSLSSEAMRARTLSTEALRASLDHLDGHSISLTALRSSQQMQPSSHADLDLAPSPVSLRPHPDHRQTFLSGHRTLSSESLALNALNLPHQLSRVALQHTHDRQRLPHSAQTLNTYNHQSAFHSDAALHMSSIHYPYSHASAAASSLMPDQMAPLSTPAPDSAGSSVRKGRSGGRSTPRIKNELYKTEICRSYSQTGGFCKYGAKCQFAHGDRERRPVRRHPRYKTKLCRNFVTTGHCPYGSRCRFIHANDLRSNGKEMIDFGMLSAMPEGAGLSFSGSMGPSGHGATNAHDLLSSDSQSTSPDHSQRHSFDMSEVRASMAYGNMSHQNRSITSTAMDNMHAVSQDMLPSMPRSAPAHPPSSVTLTDYGSSSTLQTSSFALGSGVETGADGSSAEAGPALSPSSGQPRSRLPVFQTLSDSFTNNGDFSTGSVNIGAFTQGGVAN